MDRFTTLIHGAGMLPLLSDELATLSEMDNGQQYQYLLIYHGYSAPPRGDNRQVMMTALHDMCSETTWQWCHRVPALPNVPTSSFCQLSYSLPSIQRCFYVLDIFLLGWIYYILFHNTRTPSPVNRNHTFNRYLFTLCILSVFACFNSSSIQWKCSLDVTNFMERWFLY